MKEKFYTIINGEGFGYIIQEIMEQDINREKNEAVKMGRKLVGHLPGENDEILIIKGCAITNI